MPTNGAGDWSIDGSSRAGLALEGRNIDVMHRHVVLQRHPEEDWAGFAHAAIEGDERFWVALVNHEPESGTSAPLVGRHSRMV